MPDHILKAIDDAADEMLAEDLSFWLAKRGLIMTTTQLRDEARMAGNMGMRNAKSVLNELANYREAAIARRI